MTREPLSVSAPMVVPVFAPDLYVSVDVDGTPWTSFEFDPLTGIVTVHGLKEDGAEHRILVTVGNEASGRAVRYPGWLLQTFRPGKVPRRLPPAPRGPVVRRQWWNR